MRVLVVAAIAGLFVAGMGASARACGPTLQGCGRDIVVFPAYTPEGLRIGSVGAVIRLEPRLEISRTTGRPLTVIYNNPTREPGAEDAEVTLMALPRVKLSRTRAVYPVGY